MAEIYPLFFRPIYKDYFWGGERILKEFNRKEPPGIYAESWEVSDRDDGMSIVVNGPFKGKTLHELVKKYPEELFGTKELIDHFPLLLKLIDAHDNLSIQVHPDDSCAETYGGEAKTEAWYILDATEDAVVYAGFNNKYPQEEINKKLSTRDIIPLMHTIPVEKGDTIFIPGGRLHAIGKGCLILEIQQNSNTTYRVYDWDRIDSKGKPRLLHLDQARQVIHYTDTHNPHLTPKLLEETSAYNKWNLLSSIHFKIEKWIMRSSSEWLQNPNQFDILFFQSGKGQMKWEKGSYSIEKGMTCLIPAFAPLISLDIEEDLELLRFFTSQ